MLRDVHKQLLHIVAKDLKLTRVGGLPCGREIGVKGGTALSTFSKEMAPDSGNKVGDKSKGMLARSLECETVDCSIFELERQTRQ